MIMAVHRDVSAIQYSYWFALPSYSLETIVPSRLDFASIRDDIYTVATGNLASRFDPRASEMSRPSARYVNISTFPQSAMRTAHRR